MRVVHDLPQDGSSELGIDQVKTQGSADTRQRSGEQKQNQLRIQSRQ